MQLHHIRATNILGLADTNIGFVTPVTLIAGGNGVGKSSLRDAIALALTGELSRIKLKGDVDKLVTHGASEASVTVLTDKGTSAAKITPAGALKIKQDKLLKAWADPAENPALALVLKPASFADMKPDERRELLLQVAGKSVTKELALEHLAALGLPEAKLQAVAPLLATGTQAASEFAATQGTQAKGAWKQITGEAWGGEKGTKWEAKQPQPLPDDHPAAEPLAALIDITQGVADGIKAELDGANQRLIVAQLNAERHAEDIAKAGEAERWQAKLLADQENLDNVAQQIAELEPKATGRKTGLEHDLALALNDMCTAIKRSGNDTLIGLMSEPLYFGDLALAKYTTQHGPIVTTQADPEAKAKLEELKPVHTRCTNTLATTRNLLQSAQAAQQRLDALKTGPGNDKSVTELAAEVKKLEAQHAEALAAVTRLRDQLRTVNEHAATVAQAQRVTAQAAERHRDVTEWLRIAQELGAGGGLMSKLLAEPVRDVNFRLAASAQAISTLEPHLDADSMEISARLPDDHPAAEFTPYALLSKSEQWRVDAMLAEAIGYIAGTRLLVLDAMDVIQPSERGMWLAWLEGLSQAGEMDTAIVLATMHNTPTLTSPLSRVVWLA